MAPLECHFSPPSLAFLPQKLILQGLGNAWRWWGSLMHLCERSPHNHRFTLMRNNLPDLWLLTWCIWGKRQNKYRQHKADAIHPKHSTGSALSIPAPDIPGLLPVSLCPAPAVHTSPAKDGHNYLYIHQLALAQTVEITMISKHHTQS